MSQDPAQDHFIEVRSALRERALLLFLSLLEACDVDPSVDNLRIKEIRAMARKGLHGHGASLVRRRLALPSK